MLGFMSLAKDINIHIGKVNGSHLMNLATIFCYDPMCGSQIIDGYPNYRFLCFQCLL